MSAVTLTVEVKPALWDRMKRLAERRERSPEWLMRETISQFVEREEARHAMPHRGEDAWGQFRETGRHVISLGRRLLSTWSRENEVPSPECHE